MLRQPTLVIAATAFALIVTSLTAQVVKAAPTVAAAHGALHGELQGSPLVKVRSFKRHGFKGHGFKRHGFKGHGFKRHGFKRFGFRGFGFKKHGFRGHGFKKHGFKGHKFGHRDRLYGGRRFSTNKPVYGGYVQPGYSGPRIVTVPNTTAPLAAAPLQQGTGGGESFPTKSLAARQGDGYLVQDQNGAGNDSETLSSNPPPVNGRFAAGPTPVPEGCQRVSKTGRDDSGNRVSIGGTLCFEPSGQGFIVEGSRFILGSL